MANVTDAQIYSVEIAGNYGPLFLQGEYFWYNVNRDMGLGLSSLKFDGGYFQAGYVLTGESRTYNSSAGAYGGIVPITPVSVALGGWGAWEVAARVSRLDLNDDLGRANGVAGGRQTVYTAGLNWYLNGNVRVMVNYLHGDIDKKESAISPKEAGARFDAIAMRTQVAF